MIKLAKIADEQKNQRGLKIIKRNSSCTNDEDLAETFQPLIKKVTEAKVFIKFLEEIFETSDPQKESNRELFLFEDTSDKSEVEIEEIRD